jgi:arabinogalactan endo-1,4-beta-galactosidase
MGDWKIIIPEANTNLITNPSFETNVTGWTNTGLATMEQSTTQSKFGNYSMHILANSQNDQAEETLTGLTVAGTYTTTAWVYSGDADIQLRVTSSPGAAEIGTDNWRGKLWQRIR